MQHLSLLITILFLFNCGYPRGEKAPGNFRVWATSCSHVPADIRHDRESLAKAIRQSEGLEANAPSFDWDIMIDAGDLSGHRRPPGDRAGRELIRQYRTMAKHRREQVYNVPGNHDALYYDQGGGSWFRKWGDPLGENTEFSGVDPQRRPFPVEGSWERYRFQAGNILFLMLADRNDAPIPVGRGQSADREAGGYPAGGVTRQTFNWWKSQVLDNQDKIIITMHHHGLRDTTVGSGRGEGHPRYHGSDGGLEGASYLYYIIEKDDPEDFQYTSDAHVFEDFLSEFYEKHGRGAIDLWVAGHTHAKSPDDDFGGKTISERRWGVGFLQVAALTRYHNGAHPMSRLLTFTGGSNRVTIDLYLHEASYEDNPIGWYEPASRDFPLRHRFVAPAPIEALDPFPKVTMVFDKPDVRPELVDSFTEAGPSPDLTAHWEKSQEGSLHLEKQLLEDTGDTIDSKPTLIATSPLGSGYSTSFDGSQRVRVGQIEMEDWSDLTVSCWINTTKSLPNMRIVSKDRVGEPGNFILWHRNHSVWTMQVRDDRAGKWSIASWRSPELSDGKWHHLAGVVDSRRAKVFLYVDGRLKAEAPWTAKTLDDSDAVDLVVGADSDENKFREAFQGLIYDVHLYPRALSEEHLQQIVNQRAE